MILQLFKNCKIKKNDVIEKTINYDILSYLASLESETIANLNLNKRIFSDLTVNIKINRQLRDIDVYSYNYAMITNGDERYFYFIADKQWVADSTTNLVLLLDTLNTYEYKVNIVSDTSKYDKCNVIREHRDRFKGDGTPIIDKIDEGFGTLPMEIKDTKLLGNSDKYYLGYYTSSGANAKTVCKVLKEDGEDHTKAWYNLYFTVKDFLETGENMIIYTDVNKTFLDKNAEPNSVTSTNFWDNKNLNFIYISRDTASDVKIKWGYWISSTTLVFTNENNLGSLTSWQDYYSNEPFKILRGNYQQETLILNKAYSLYEILGTYTSDTYSKTAGLNYIIPAFTDTLKADSNILKIIEVPYFQQLDIYPYYDFNMGAIIGATNNINEYSMSFSSKDLYAVSLPSSLDNQLADKKFETKLLSSQFTTNMFKYDSFNYTLAAEEMTIPQTAFDIKVHIPIDMSTTVAFEFDWKGTEINEFDRWLITQRNNQVPTMSNKYLEYMQNGYNYDVKNRNIQTALNWTSFAGQVGGAAFSMGSSIGNLVTNHGLMKDAKAYDWFKKVMSKQGDWFPGMIEEEAKKQGLNPSLKRSDLQTSSMLATQNIYNSSNSLVSGLFNNIVSTIQSQESIDKRKKDYLNSSENISNSDDITLFNIYNEGNKLRYSKYQPREDIVNSVSNVLRFSGYNTNQYKTPDLNSRWFYNYLAADITYKSGQYIPTIMLEDIKSSIQSGITLFHYKKGYGYDLDRKYENWENVLSGGSPTPGPTPTPGELTDLIVTGDTVLKDDGYFYYVSYQITNPNNTDISFNGSLQEDGKVVISNFSLKAGETIGDKLEVDGKHLTLNGTLSAKEN